MKLVTERLILRQLQEKDAGPLFPLINDPDVAAGMLCVPYPFPEEALIPTIRGNRASMARKERLELAVVLQETGLPIGICRLRDISWEHMNGELGYWLGKRYWRYGYMTEAVRRVVACGFDDLGLERIYACCFAHNAASSRVLEKAGLRFEYRATREMKKEGRLFDLVHYGMIREDYENCDWRPNV